MPNYSLLFARTAQDADDSASLDWKWDKVGDLGHHEYRRPDTGERVRYVEDGPQSLQNLRWNTRVYCGRNWNRRADAARIKSMLRDGFFSVQDPELPPPRPRARKDETLSEMRRMLARLERP